MVPALEPDLWFKVNRLEGKENAGKKFSFDEFSERLFQKV